MSGTYFLRDGLSLSLFLLIKLILSRVKIASVFFAQFTMGIAPPSDVLLLIGEQLDRQTDRWNLLFVSQHFHDLFLPLLYRKARLRNWHDARSFLQAVLDRPALARAVRELDLKDWHAKPATDHEQPDITQCALLNDCLHSVSQSPDERSQCEEGLRNGLSDAWIALMLPLLSRLRKLHLTHAARTPCLDRTMQRAINLGSPSGTSPAFRCLEEVSLHYREDLDCLVHDQRQDHDTGDAQSSSTLILPFFQLPSVRAIIADSVVDPSADFPAVSEPKAEDADEEDQVMGSSNITEIDLRTSSGNHGMESLVASCANLKSFKYQHSDSHVLSHGYQPSAFYRSLTRSKGTLQTLWLDHYGSHYPFTAAGLNQTHDEWFGSLSDFVSLREVRIRLPNLLDVRYQNEPTAPLVECLPPSLETLYIESCEERQLSMLVSQLQTVIKDPHQRVPRLQRLDVEGPFQGIPSDDSSQNVVTATGALKRDVKRKVLEAAEPMHVDCANAGIELHIHNRMCPTHIGGIGG